MFPQGSLGDHRTGTPEELPTGCAWPHNLCLTTLSWTLSRAGWPGPSITSPNISTLTSCALCVVAISPPPSWSPAPTGYQQFFLPLCLSYDCYDLFCLLLFFCVCFYLWNDTVISRNGMNKIFFITNKNIPSSVAADSATTYDSCKRVTAVV